MINKNEYINLYETIHKLEDKFWDSPYISDSDLARILHVLRQMPRVEIKGDQ